MNKLTKYILIATIVAVGIWAAFNLIMWLVVNTILELIEICLIFSCL
jgi:hypothetical protein